MFGSSKREQFSLQALQLLDGALVWFSFAVASTIRWNVVGNQNDGLGLAPISWLLFILVPFTPLTLELFGFYRNPLNRKLSAALWKMMQTAGVIVLFVGILVVSFQLDPSSRIVLGAGGVSSFVLVFFRFVWVRSVLRRRVKNGASREKAILVGLPEETEAFIKNQPEEVLAYLDIQLHFDITTRAPLELADEIVKLSAQRVIISPHQVVFDTIGDAVEVAETQGVEVWIAADFIRSQLARPKFDSMGEKPMLVLKSTPELSWALLTKSFCDKCFALSLLVFTAPLWVIAALGILFSDPGPIFFRQRRSGKFGKEFSMWKFRTMCVDAEEKLAAIKKQVGNNMTGPVFKLDDDPRVFPFAKWLRKTSIDELPQLLNVLAGEMSMVGPRPLPVYEVKDFEKMAYRRRLSVKPGITCTWQAGGRNSINNFEEWVEMDLEYIDNWSLWKDLKIVLKTVPAVLFGTGAK
ncbi:sugar transferase [Rubritalea marina]|uniref:sugar transferase n=1 Tax=Rubritalea marina TaxID=361055 RepID=UPI00036A4CF9|nr:sugar transferase [Rubritalea marina]